MPTGRIKLKLCCLGLFILLLSFGRVLAAPKLKATEDEVKAAYLYNFALFTKWPATAFSDAQAPFVVAVLADDSFAQELEKSLAKATVGSRSVSIIRLPRGSRIPDCHLLYISLAEKGRVEEILQETSRKPILTVSDINPFCRMGGCIRFVRNDSRLDLRMNPRAAAARGLQISSDLLAIATIVETDPPK